MGLRYRKRIRLPFGRLNLSRSSASISVGRPGAWLTFGHGRRRATLSWPGSGLGYTSISSHSIAPGRRSSGRAHLVTAAIAAAGTERLSATALNGAVLKLAQRFTHETSIRSQPLPRVCTQVSASSSVPSRS